MALIKNAPRNATIHCLTHSYFATLDKKDFAKYLKKINNKLELEKLNFFKNLSYFAHNTTMNMKKKVIPVFVKSDCKMGEIMYQ